MGPTQPAAVLTTADWRGNSTTSTADPEVARTTDRGTVADAANVVPH